MALGNLPLYAGYWWDGVLAEVSWRAVAADHADPGALGLAYLVREPGEWRNWAGLLPFVPAAVVRKTPNVSETLGKAYRPEILQRNLERYGLKKAATQHTHHILGNNERARDIIEQWKARGIDFDVNEALNGMFLDRGAHQRLTCNPKYRDYVNRTLRELQTRERVIDEIENIKRQLLKAEREYLRTGRTTGPWFNK